MDIAVYLKHANTQRSTKAVKPLVTRFRPLAGHCDIVDKANLSDGRALLCFAVLCSALDCLMFVHDVVMRQRGEVRIDYSCKYQYSLHTITRPSHR